MEHKISNKILYLCIHKRISDKVGRRKIISIKFFHGFLGEMYRVPKNLRRLVTIEMEKMNMVKKLNAKELEVLPMYIDPEENVNKFYKQLGLFD